MPFIIDAHEDLAYNILNFGRDYRLSAAETRAREAGTEHPQHAGGNTLLGWPDYQRGQVALVFGTLFLSPKKYAEGDWDNQAYRTCREAYTLHHAQVDAYARLCDESPDKFQLVRNRKELGSVMAPWQETPASYPTATHPTGIVMLMEGAEGVERPEEMEEWWQRGIRVVGPVWAGGGRWCGGNADPAPLSPDGRKLLSVMAELGFILDISHMCQQAVLDSLDYYPGTIIATHANCNSLLKDYPNQRHLTDEAIRLLVQRGGVMGAMPYNRFLLTGWKPGVDPRSQVPLERVADHIDHICQIAGDARHTGLGSDFDGGFGVASAPDGVDTIADLQKLVQILQIRGYNETDIQAILGGNWLRRLEDSLPV